MPSMPSRARYELTAPRMAPIRPVGPATAGARRRLRPTRSRPIETADAHLGWLARAAVSPTLVLDGRGRIHQVSRSATDLLGHAAADLIGQGIDHLVFPLDVGAILAMVRSNAFGSTDPVEARIRHLDGRWLTVEAVGTRVDDTDTGRHLVLTLHDVTKWKAIEEQLTQQAFHDPLTGLPNRALFVQQLDGALGRRRYHARGAAVLFLDLDDFKIVNDSLGHVEGDNLLRQVADRLREAIRPARPRRPVRRRRVRAAARRRRRGRRAERRQSRPRRPHPGVRADRQHGPDRRHDRDRAQRRHASRCRRHAPGRGHRDVQRQDRRQGPRAGLRAVDAPRGRRTPAPRRRHPRRRGARRIRPALPADRAPPERRDQRHGGPAALAAPGARADPAVRVHPPRRVDRPDHPDRRVRAARSVPAGAGVAARAPGQAAA